MHLDLIIAGIGVYKAKELVFCRSLYQLVDPRERITILQAGFVEIFKVDADSPLLVLILHEDGIGEPVRVERFSDEANLE